MSKNYYLANGRYFTSKKAAEKYDCEIEVFDELEVHYGGSYLGIDREEMLSIAETWSTAFGYVNFTNDRGKVATLRPEMTDNITNLPYSIGQEIVIEGYDGSDDCEDITVRASEMTCARQRYGVSNESLYEFYRFFKSTAEAGYIEEMLDVDYRLCKTYDLPYKVGTLRTEDMECPWCSKRHEDAKANSDGLYDPNFSL